jgi:oligopeptide/dipeptide ABC transporter ATP-binding protein
VVARYADRVNVMYAGKIVEEGTAKQIYHQPRHPYTIGLLNSVPRMDLPRGQKLIPIDGSPPDLTRLDDGCSYRPRCKWRISRCDKEFPPLARVNETQLSACWRKDELDNVLQKMRQAS